jgi:putative PIG3 family NAD(P)H quinone oxidoreductase
MQAILVQSAVPERPLVWQETASPYCGPHEVLVDIYATALNRADLLQRAGNYPPPPGAPDILGLEMAGRIVHIGDEVKKWQVGDRVCALLAGGGYAEQVAVHHRLLMPVPAGWNFLEAAALPEVYLTAFVNLYMEANLRQGESVLVHGGASGVGTAAIQLLAATKNPVFVTAGTPEKVARCRELGATLAIHYHSEDFVEKVRSATDGQGVDVIMDMVGASYFTRNLELLKLRGRLVFIATLGGGQVEFDIGALMRRRLRLIGSVLRSRTIEEKVEIKNRFAERFWPLLEAGSIKPVLDRIYPIQEAGAAHAHMAANANIGKIVLQVRPEE